MEILEKQKQSAKKSFVDYGISTVIMAVLCILAVFAVSSGDAVYMYLIMLIGAGVCVYLVYRTATFLGLYSAYNKITNVNTEKRSLVCRKIQLYGVAKGKMSSALVALTLVCDGGEKYTYVLSKREEYDSSTRKKYEQKLLGKPVEAECYEGTNKVCNIKI